MIPTLQLGQLGRTLARMPGQVGWTPADLTAPPSIWCGVDSPVTIGTGLLTQWNDRTANAFHFSAAGGLRPAVTDPDTTLSNLRTVGPDGTNDLMTSAVAGVRAIWNGASGAWWAGVYKKTGATTGLRYAFQSPTNAAGQTRFAATSTNTTNHMGIRGRRADADAVGQLDAATAHDGAWHMWLLQVELATRTATIYLDDLQDAQNTTFTSVGGTFSATDAVADPGFAGTSAGANLAAFQTAEWMVGRTVPTTTERRKLFGYLAWRFGLVSLLPPTSPYLLAPP